MVKRVAKRANNLWVFLGIWCFVAVVGRAKRKSACVGVMGFNGVGSKPLWKVWAEGLRNP